MRAKLTAQQSMYLESELSLLADITADLSVPFAVRLAVATAAAANFRGICISWPNPSMIAPLPP